MTTAPQWASRQRRRCGAWLGALILAGCATPPPPPPAAAPAPRPVRSYAVLLDNADGTAGKIVVRGAGGEQIVDRPRTGVPLDGSRSPSAIPDERLRTDFGTAMAARPPLPERFLLYFETAGANLTAASQAQLPQILEAIGRRPAPEVSIIGHTDTVGSAEANAALGRQRAETIARLIRERGLTGGLTLEVESHGESNPLVATPDETAEPRNRRVEVSIR